MLACGDTSSRVLTLPDTPIATSQITTPVTTPSAPASTTTAATVTLPPTIKATASGTSASSVIYDFDNSLPEQDQALIRRGIELAKQALGEAGKVRVTASRATAKYQPNPNVFAVSAPNEILVFPYSQIWKEAPEAERLVTLVHEYYHLVQYQLSGSTSLSSRMTNSAALIEPFWLVEGSAEYFAYRVVGEAGALSFDDTRADLVKNVRREPLPLSSLETKTPDQYLVMDPYSMGFLAAQYLVEDFGGQTALSNYWQLSLSSSKWQEAFHQAFKVTTTEFYQKFEQYRQKAFPSDLPVGIVPTPVFTGPLKISFLGTLDPALLRNTRPQSAPYLFVVSGVNIRELGSDGLQAALTLPDEVYHSSYLGGNCLAIYFNPDTPPGNYTIGLDLPDGHTTEIKFQYPSTQKVKPPTSTP
jgi:hypothetical protein